MALSFGKNLSLSRITREIGEYKTDDKSKVNSKNLKKFLGVMDDVCEQLFSPVPTHDRLVGSVDNALIP